MKILLIIIASVIVVFSLPSAAGEINQNKDFQVWLHQGVDKKLTEKTKLYLNGEVRFADDASIMYLFFLQAGFIYSIDKYLEIGPGYRQLYVLDVFGEKWNPIYEPLLDITLKFTLKGWRITDRNRPSYLFFDSLPNLWQYRNRLTVYTPWKLGKIALNPLVFDEIFVREGIGFFENRFAVGGEFSLGKRSKATALYLLRHIDIESWQRQNILFLMLSYSF